MRLPQHTASGSRLAPAARRWGRSPSLKSGGWWGFVRGARGGGVTMCGLPRREGHALHEGATGECAGVSTSHHLSTLRPSAGFFFSLKKAVGNVIKGLV